MEETRKRTVFSELWRLWRESWRYEWKSALMLGGYFSGFAMLVSLFSERGRTLVMDMWWCGIIVCVIGAHWYIMFDAAMSMKHNNPNDKIAARLETVVSTCMVLGYLAAFLAPTIYSE